MGDVVIEVGKRCYAHSITAKGFAPSGPSDLNFRPWYGQGRIDYFSLQQAADHSALLIACLPVLVDLCRKFNRQQS